MARLYPGTRRLGLAASAGDLREVDTGPELERENCALEFPYRKLASIEAVQTNISLACAVLPIFLGHRLYPPLCCLPFVPQPASRRAFHLSAYGYAAARPSSVSPTARLTLPFCPLCQRKCFFPKVPCTHLQAPCLLLRAITTLPFYMPRFLDNLLGRRLLHGSTLSGS